MSMFQQIVLATVAGLWFVPALVFYFLGKRSVYHAYGIKK